MSPERFAQKFHDIYERLAPNYGYARKAVPWDEVSTHKKDFLIAVCTEILDKYTLVPNMNVEEALEECRKWRLTDDELRELES